MGGRESEEKGQRENDGLRDGWRCSREKGRSERR